VLSSFIAVHSTGNRCQHQTIGPDTLSDEAIENILIKTQSFLGSLEHIERDRLSYVLVEAQNPQDTKLRAGLQLWTLKSGKASIKQASQLECSLHVVDSNAICLLASRGC